MKTNQRYLATMAILTVGALCSSASMADDGWYAGGAIGRAYIDEDIGAIQLDADSTTFRVFAGYAFSDYVGLEASYLDLGTFEDSVDVAGVPVDVSADADGFSFAAVGRLPLGEKFSLRGKAGVFFWDGQSTVNGITENDPSDQNAFVGAGFGYDLSQKASLFLDLDYYDLDGVEPLLATLGFSFSF